MNQPILIKQKGKVTRDYSTASMRPLTVRTGDRITLGRKDPEWPGWVWGVNADGQSAWVPESYLRREGDKGILLVDYTSRELSLHTGEELELQYQESGWYWARNQNGETGWAPSKHIQVIED